MFTHYITVVFLMLCSPGLASGRGKGSAASLERSLDLWHAWQRQLPLANLRNVRFRQEIPCVDFWGTFEYREADRTTLPRRLRSYRRCEHTDCPIPLLGCTNYLVKDYIHQDAQSRPWLRTRHCPTSSSNVFAAQHGCLMSKAIK